MRYSRQDKILELIRDNEIETQEALAQLLKDNGFSVTQATVSRDIRELQLIKALTPSGKYKYALPSADKPKPSGDRFEKIFRNTVTEINYSGNIIVLKTLSGCANAAAESLDSLKFDGVIGSLAGDNTVFIVVDLPEHASGICDKFRSILRDE
ncbi:MAG: arginine repressor [Clostridia bacterium]|nr:arginine repressor [Clostridia bacterium]